MENESSSQKRSLRAVIVPNLILWLILWGALELGLRGQILLPWVGSQPAFVCQLPQGTLFILTAWFVLLAHSIWRAKYPQNIALLKEIKIKNVPLQLFDLLHPWALRNRTFFSLVIVLGVVVFLVGQSPFFPFRAPASAPIIRGFTASMDGTPLDLQNGNVIQVEAGHLVLVQAQVMGTEPSCSWSAVKGSLQTADQCSAVYSLPFTEERDIITVVVQSTCGTGQVLAAIHVHTTSSKP